MCLLKPFVLKNANFKAHSKWIMHNMHKKLHIQECGTNGSTLVKQYEWYEMTAETYALNYSERSFIEQKSDKKAVLI